MLCIACHYMKRGDSAFFTDPDNMNFRMMMYFFWGSVAYAFWNVGVGSSQPYFVGNNGPFFVGKLGANQ